MNGYEYVLVDPPEELWKKTKDEAGIDKVFFDRYYKNREEAVAYKLINIKKYNNPMTLMDLGVKCAPQSYRYV